MALPSTAGFAVPLVIGASLGRPDLGATAALGSFVGFYGAHSPEHLRTRVLLWVAAGLMTATALATMFARSEIAIGVIGGVLSTGLTYGALRHRVGPPREFFVVLVFFMVSAFPADPSAAPQRAGLVVLGAAAAIGISLLEHAVLRRTPRSAPGANASRAEHRTVALRIGGGVVLGYGAGIALGVSHPSWVAITAVAVLQATERAHVHRRAGHRVLGSMLGVAITAAVSAVDPPTGVLVTALVLMQFVLRASLAVNYTLAVAAITPLVLLVLQIATRQPALDFIADRITDTIVGALIAVLVIATTARPAAEEQRPLPA